MDSKYPPPWLFVFTIRILVLFSRENVYSMFIIYLQETYSSKECETLGEQNGETKFFLITVQIIAKGP